PIVVAGFGASGIRDVLELRRGERVERPAFGTVLAGGSRSIQDLALAAVEAGEMSTGEHSPDDAIAVDIEAAWRVSPRRREFVDFGERGFGGIRTRIDANYAAREAQCRTQD